MATKGDQEFEALKVICQYLLFERKQETQLSMAFSLLVQERHNEFHTLGEHKIGDETDFSTCKNEICMASFNVLKDSRSMAVEINDFTLKLVSDYTLHVSKVGNICRAYLTEQSKIVEGDAK